ncbi:MAG: hypothetical protein ABIR35_06000 [Polaromonas sp.]
MDELTESKVPCCPVLEPDRVCDVLDFHYRLKHNTDVVSGGRRVQVEVIIHARFERCPGPMTLGDLSYSTTLLPGEKVRLFTADRRTRFSFDSASRVSYRNEQTSEERFYMASLHDSMSDVSVRDSSTATSASHGSANGHGGASGAVESFLFGPSVDVSGSYEASSTNTFLRQLTQHASASDRRSEMGTRAASSVSVGEVQTRVHTEGESEDHFESASREFSNPNKCHAVTFFFYQINKTQKVRYTIESIERRVIDPVANTRITNNAFAADGDVDAIPNGVLATDENRLQKEEIGRQSVAARQRVAAVNNLSQLASFSFAAGIPLEPIPAVLAAKALQQIDQSLIKEGLLDQRGKLTEETKKSLSFERVSSLPTPGLLVKGCLDECNICEETLMKEMDLDLARKQLENELLKKQIDLLEKSQQYRCCPGNSEAGS